MADKESKLKQQEAVVVAINEGENKLFALCTSDYVAVANELDMPKSKLGTCIDSRASSAYCPDQSKFITYRLVNHKITTANGQTLNVIGMGDLQLELPNRSGKTVTIFKDAIHTPKAFTLNSISKLNRAGFSVTFNKGMWTIKNPKGTTIATISHSNRLYMITAGKIKIPSETANTASVKMSLMEAHRKLGHISISAIKHAISKGFITSIDIDLNSKFKFCKACTKAKSAHQPFPKESETRAINFRECIHWDLWGPASVKSLNGNHYMAARIDDATRQRKLHFQEKKSQTFESYKKDKAYIENQTGNHIKNSQSDQEREFLSMQMINHQDMKGTKRELTMHNSPPQNRVS